MKKLICAALLLSSKIALADHTFLPPNAVVGPTTAPTMTKAQFDKVLDKAEAYYKPLIKDAFGAELKINRRWSDPTVNASAYQLNRLWYLNMYGGLARRVTEDGFLTVVCHELGHHLGGYPFYSRNGWAAASEGQSDYFATLSCVRNIIKDEKAENERLGKAAPAVAKKMCDGAHEGIDDRQLCYRLMLAGKSTADLLSGGGRIGFDTPDRRQVPKTSESHPAAQCRLDTFVAGALCAVEFDEKTIPGKDLGAAKNSEEAERESAEVTCHGINGHKVGLRPRCWFAPKVK